jgi:hypothetical protein
MPLVAVLRPVDVEVDKLLTLLLVVLSPVDRLEMPLVAVLKPVEVEVDKLVTALLVVLRPVDRLAMPLVAVLNPVDVEVERLRSWSTLTASVPEIPAASAVMRLPPILTFESNVVGPCINTEFPSNINVPSGLPRTDAVELVIPPPPVVVAALPKKKENGAGERLQFTTTVPVAPYPMPGEATLD